MGRTYESGDMTECIRVPAIEVFYTAHSMLTNSEASDFILGADFVLVQGGFWEH